MRPRWEAATGEAKEQRLRLEGSLLSLPSLPPSAFLLSRSRSCLGALGAFFRSRCSASLEQPPGGDPREKSFDKKGPPPLAQFPRRQLSRRRLHCSGLLPLSHSQAGGVPRGSSGAGSFSTHTHTPPLTQDSEPKARAPGGGERWVDGWLRETPDRPNLAKTSQGMEMGTFSLPRAPRWGLRPFI